MLPYAACTLGAAAGFGFARLWLRAVPWNAHRMFWSAMSALTLDFLRADDVRLLPGLYCRLGGLVGGYVARNVGGTLFASLPLAAILLLAAPLLLPDAGIVFFASFAVATFFAMLWPMRS